jgi:ankyrin repeat protein
VLLKNRATIDPKDEYGSTPLHYAAWFGDRKFVEELLAYRAHIEEVNGRNNTPLDLALQFDRIENIKALLLAGAYIKDGWRTKIWLNFEPLEYYILFGDFEEVQELLEFHPALASGQALAYAAGQGHIGITQLLLCYDISPFPAQKVILDILAQRALYPEQQAIYMNIGSLLQDRITYLEGLTQLVINPQLNSYFNLLPPDIRRLLHPTACPFMYGK